MRRRAVLIAALTTMSTVAAFAAVPAAAAAAGPEEQLETVSTQLEDTEPDRVPDPDATLGARWRDSADRAVTTSGDADGLHVLVADRREAYRWRTVATLTEPMLETDQWIGQLCVIGSGNRAVVVYAPRSFTNHAVLMESGAFAAVVDLDTGEVVKLDERVTLAYYNPSCGAGDTAVLSRIERPSADGEAAHTWISTLDVTEASWGDQSRPVGQLSSAVPVGERIIAAKGYTLVEVGAGGETTVLAATNGAPLRLMPEGGDGIAFQVARQDEVDLARLVGDEVRTVATVPTGAVKLRPGAGGQVYAVGVRASERVPAALPAGWRSADALPDSEPSTTGELLVTRARTGIEAAGRLVPERRAGGPAPVRIDAQLLDAPDPAELEFAVQPADSAPGGRLSAALGGPTGPDGGNGPAAPESVPSSDHSTVPWDPDRSCSVPRNDPQVQTYQPSAEEVEWAVNLAVHGELTVTREADWHNSGLPSYSPQGLFPSRQLSGGGNVPAQIMLAILAQESNLYQASWRVVNGLAGNPLVPSGFYGLHWENPDPRLIDWEGEWVDCGYGTAQVTTGMHASDTDTVVGGVLMDYTKQRAVAQDYAVNVAAGLRILQEKWNQIYDAGIIANNGDPSYLENWWFAIWAYNSGFQPDSRFGNDTGCTPSPSCTDPHGNWGLGWSNNPASPLYPEDRQMFLTAPLDHPDVDPPDQVGYDNARHPNHWSYPERVMGFAYTSLRQWDYQSQSYRDTYRTAARSPNTEAAQPGRFAFCVEQVNHCDPEAEKVPGQFPDYPAGPCLRDDLRCWWNAPASWGAPDCEWCGVENRRYTAGDPPPPMAEPIHSAECGTAGLPADALIVNSLDSAEPLGPRGCPRTWGDHGTFEMEFGSAAGPQGDPVYPSKVDLHQINGGFGGHFWVGHLHSTARPWMEITGTWQLDQVVNGPAVVWVHLPDHGARTLSAKYEIETATGTKVRDIAQYGEGNRWMSLGAFAFDGEPRVRLSNLASGADGSVSIAFDAIAVQPVPGTLERHQVEAYALFDEDQDLDTDSASTWWADTPFKSRQDLYDWGYDTSDAVVSLEVCTGEITSACVPQQVWLAMVDWWETVMNAGTDPTDHPPGESIATWVNFANPHTYRPTSPAKPEHFDTDDGSYKIRSGVEVSFVTGPDGRVVAGSEHVDYSHRTGDTHLPEFVVASFEAIASDYGIPVPNLTYTLADLHQHDGAYRTARPHLDGVLPGRAYAYGGKAPTITDGGACVAARYISGGSIGYRPMLAVSALSDRVAGWVDEVQNDPRIAPAVGDLAGEIYNAFFKDGTTGSIFVQSPPIWQQLSAKVCVDGSVSTYDGEPILRASQMPDQYLYYDGQAIDREGTGRGSRTPIMTGDFLGFSNTVDRVRPHPYGWCYPDGGRNGNPWEIALAVPADPGLNPSQVLFCADGSEPDPGYHR